MISTFLAKSFKYFGTRIWKVAVFLVISHINLKNNNTLNNKEFITELSQRLNYSNRDTTRLVSSVLSIMTQELQDGKSVTIQGFGTFEVKKKLERISFNPITPHRLLIPPKLVLTYKPSITLKEKFK